MTPAEIAALLTPAQRRTLMVLPADGSPVAWTSRGAESWFKRGWVCASAEVLKRHGLIRTWIPWPPVHERNVHPECRHFCNAYGLSPLGAEVRALVAQEDAQ